MKRENTGNTNLNELHELSELHECRAMPGGISLHHTPYL
jgi:hypothetical protein